MPLNSIASFAPSTAFTARSTNSVLAACAGVCPGGRGGDDRSTGQNGIGEDIGLVLDGEIAKVRMGVFVGGMFGKGLAGRCVYDKRAGIQ